MTPILVRLLTATLLALPTAALAQNSSVYTALDLDACAGTLRVVDEPTGETAWSGVCAGHDGIAVLVADGDDRYDLDFGLDNDRFETAPFFNEPHSVIEWRLSGAGEAFAVIHRFWSSGFTPRFSMFGVSKVGRPGAPGCLVALFDGSLPDANARAVALADAMVDRLDCAQLPAPLMLE